jgi:hypothetical protein
MVSVGEVELAGVVSANKLVHVLFPAVLMQAAKISASVLIFVESGVIIVVYVTLLIVLVAVAGPDEPAPILARFPTCTNPFANPVTFAAGAPIVHAGFPPGAMFMNCCKAVTEATVVTSLTTTKVLAVDGPQGVGNAAINAAYWLAPAPGFPPTDVM